MNDYILPTAGGAIISGGVAAAARPKAIEMAERYRDTLLNRLNVYERLAPKLTPYNTQNKLRRLERILDLLGNNNKVIAISALMGAGIGLGAKAMKDEYDRTVHGYPKTASARDIMLISFMEKISEDGLVKKTKPRGLSPQTAGEWLSTMKSPHDDKGEKVLKDMARRDGLKRLGKAGLSAAALYGLYRYTRPQKQDKD